MEINECAEGELFNSHCLQWNVGGSEDEIPIYMVFENLMYETQTIVAQQARISISFHTYSDDSQCDKHESNDFGATANNNAKLQILPEGRTKQSLQYVRTAFFRHLIAFCVSLLSDTTS